MSEKQRKERKRQNEEQKHIHEKVKQSEQQEEIINKKEQSMERKLKTFQKQKSTQIEEIYEEKENTSKDFEDIRIRAKKFSQLNQYDQYEKQKFGELFFNEKNQEMNHLAPEKPNVNTLKVNQISKDIISVRNEEKQEEEGYKFNQGEDPKHEHDKDEELNDFFDLKEFGLEYSEEFQKNQLPPKATNARKRKHEQDSAMFNINEFPNILELEREIIERYKVDVEDLPPFIIYTSFNEWYQNVFLNQQPESEKIDEQVLKKEYKEYLTKKLEATKTYLEELKQSITSTQKEFQRYKQFIKKMNEFPKIIGTVLDYYESTNRIHVKLSNNNKIIIEFSQPRTTNQNLEPGTRISLSDRTLDFHEILKNEVDSFISGMEIQSGSIDTTFADVGGLENQIQELREAVEFPITKPHIFERIGIEPPKGVLLYGPPGSGKTLLARAVAANAKATFIRLVGSELVQMYIGEGARLVRELFRLARQKAPSIIFIDEIDSIGAMRVADAQSSENEIYRTLMTLLAEIDGFDSTSNVRFIAATNMAEILDPALLRPGRFDRKIYIQPPDKKGREAIFKIMTRKMKLEPKDAYQKLIDLTEGTTGADIKNIVMEAGMFAIRENADSITEAHFMAAFNKLKEKSFKRNPTIPNFAYS